MAGARADPTLALREVQDNVLGRVRRTPSRWYLRPWREGALVRERAGMWLWPLMASIRLRTAFRQHWKRLFAVVGGAISLAALEFHDVISRTTSDDLGVILVLYGVGLGALNAYTFRPRAQAERSR